MLFIEYPSCTTCKKAKKFLDSHGIVYDVRHIKEEAPTAEELAKWIPLSQKDVQKFFNTSGQVYRTEQIKEKLPSLSEAEKIALLAGNGMLVKRPILVLEDKVLVGFKEEEWKAALHV